MKFPYTVLAVVLSLVLIAAAFAAGALKTGLDANSTPIVLGMLAMVSGVVPGLLALIKSEQINRNVDETREKVNKVHDDMGNGVMEAHIENAVRKANRVNRKERNAAIQSTEG